MIEIPLDQAYPGMLDDRITKVVSTLKEGGLLGLLPRRRAATAVAVAAAAVIGGAAFAASQDSPSQELRTAARDDAPAAAPIIVAQALPDPTTLLDCDGPGRAQGIFDHSTETAGAASVQDLVQSAIPEIYGPDFSVRSTAATEFTAQTQIQMANKVVAVVGLVKDDKGWRISGIDECGGIHE